ncbi:adhesion G protein-coupled receptor E1-like [Callorhinchus milii]|uniref:adhesion G protein-coupled receptor E1-like n=1 Tax=Callorhinchus milii TaxID=7868 RepID=UPI001C3F9CDC|nr:adhesion G protein-coupled receptor E1-like [Callorhinchus milii]
MKRKIDLKSFFDLTTLNIYNLLGNNSQSLSGVVKLVDSIVSNTKQWEQIDRRDRHRAASSLLDTVANYVLETFNASNGRVSVTSQYIDIEVHVAPENVSLNDTLALDMTDNTLNTYWRIVTAENQSDKPVVGFLAYSNMETILDGYFDDEENKVLADYQLNSKVVTITSKKNISDHMELMNFTLKHKKKMDANKKPRCAMWKHTSERQGWSVTGCHVITSTEEHTSCGCSQLASFAILMTPFDVEAGPALHIITQVGIIASLVCLTICILTFLFCRTLQRETRTIYLNLSVSLFLAELLFVTGITRTSNKISCAIIAGALHYLFLAAFTWMFLDGLQLFLLVKNLSRMKASHSSRLREMGLYAFGYGIPAIIVGISAAVNPGGFGSPRFCWLQLQRGFIWSFIGPVIAIILINTILFIGTLWTLREKLSGLNTQVSKIKDKRMLAFKAVGQVFVLGCTWILGVFHFQKGTVVMAYLFTIVNSFQGVFIFIFLCVLNKQVREEYRWCFARVNRGVRSSYTVEMVSASAQMTGTSADGSGKSLEH